MLLTLNEIKNLTEEKVNALKENQIAEDKHLEYKLTLPGEKYEDKKEFLSDISSFANADGGVIFYGIKAKDGIPQEIPGLEIDNTDANILRLENLLRTSIEPRIIGTYFHPFKLSNSRYLIIAYIPKSFNPPHVVNFQAHWKFYSRNSAGKYPMDLGEVISSISLADHLYEKIKNFRLERISRIISNDLPIKLSETPKLVLHILPLSSFEKSFNVDLSMYLYEYQNLRPIFNGISFKRYNFDGLLTFSTMSDFKTSDAYLLFFHNGIIETVSANILTRNDGYRQKTIHIESFSNAFINEASRLLDEIINIQINTPIVISLSLLSVRDFGIFSSNPALPTDQSIDRDNLFLPEVLLIDFNEKIETILKPIFDSLWQSFGFSKCRFYNDNGEWILK